MIKVPFGRPDISKKEINRVIKVLKNPILAHGPLSNEFEKKDIYFCIFKEIGKSNKYSAIVISQIESGSELYNYLMSFNYKSRKLINCPTTDFSGLTFDEFLKKLNRNVRSVQENDHTRE